MLSSAELIAARDPSQALKEIGTPYRGGRQPARAGGELIQDLTPEDPR